MSDAAPSLSAAPATVLDRDHPWPGLRSYDESMHALFFGRAAEVDELLRLVRRDPVALFYGQSGLGKSSVLQAGLFPKLRAVDMLPVHIRLRYAPEFPHPVEQVLSEVVAAARAAGGEASTPAPGSSLFEYFYDDQHDFWSARNRVLTPVLVFDQFEEIFTLGGRDEASRQRREELLQQLADLAAHRPPAALVARFEETPELAARFSTDRTRCRMLFSMREDFLPELGNLRAHLPTLPTSGLRLQRLTGLQAQEVLERAGAHLLGDGVTERIIRFVAAEKSAGATDLSKLDVEPALLSVVASELNFRRRQRGLEKITTDLVQGAREEILNDFYERALAGLDGRVREFIEEQLLTTTGFRDSIAVEDAEASFGVSREVIAQLVDGRLLRIDERFQLQRVELTHDLLTAVVKSSRDRRRERQAAEAAQRRAEEDKRTAQAAAAQAQAKLKRTRIRAAVTGAMILLGLGIIVPSILLRQASRARDEVKEANRQLEARRREEVKQSTSRFIITEAKEHLARGNYDAARLVLTLAPTSEMEIFPPAQLGLLSAALDEPSVLQLEGVLKLASGLRQVAFAPGGRLLILDPNGALQLATATNATLEPSSIPGALGKAANISSVDLEWIESGRLAVATEAGELAIFDLATGNSIATLPLPDQRARSATATTTGGGGIEKETATEKGGSRPNSASSSTEPVLEVSGAGGAAGGSSSVQRPAHAVKVKFSPDGTKLAAALSDGRLVVWQRATADWTGTPQVFWTRKTEFAPDAFTRTEVDINWLLDGTIFLSHGSAGVWLAAPSESWATVEPLQEIAVPGVRQATAPAASQLESDVFVSLGPEAKVSWRRLVTSTDGDGPQSNVRASVTLPDRILGHAVVDQQGLLLTALRDGAIAIHRITPATENQREDVLEMVQTVSGPKADHVALTVRPDGRIVAAAADDGRIFLYRVKSTEPGSGREPGVPRRLVHSSSGWWQITAQGAVIAPDGVMKAEAMNVASASGLPLVMHSLHGADANSADAVAFVSLASDNADPAAGPVVGVWSFGTKTWLWKKPENAFALQRAGEIAGFEDAIQFSPDGSSVLITCRAESMVHVVATADGRERVAPIRLPEGQRAHQIAWSGDGRRIAIATDELQVVVVELPASDRGDARMVAVIPARSYDIHGLALDQAGAVLGHVTPDNRLVLDFIEQNDWLPSFIVPLGGPRVTGLAFAPDGSAMALASRSGLAVRKAQNLTTEEIERIEWTNQRTRKGFRFAAFPADRPTDLRNLDVTVWQDDQGNRAAAAFQHAWTGIVQDWFAWVAEAREVVTHKPTPALENARVTELLERARLLVERVDEHTQGRPVLAAFRERAFAASSEPVALYEFFGVTPLWSQVGSYLMEGGELTLISPGQAEKLLPGIVARLKTDDKVSDRETLLMRHVISVLAVSPTGGALLGNERATLRSPKLFSAEEWSRMAFDSPDNRFLDAEAAALFRDADYAGSIRCYDELTRRDPANLRYATLNAQNFRFQRLWAEALGRYQVVLDRAQEQGLADYAAEASLCIGWCLQGLERIDEADAAMIKGVEMAPENAWVLRYASEYFLDRGQPERVEAWTAHLLELGTEPEYRYVRARYLTTRQDLAGAREQLRAAIATGTASPQFHFDAGAFLATFPLKDDKETAAKWLLEAYQQTSDRSLEFNALAQLGTLWMTLNSYTGALSCYRLRLENYTPSDHERLDAYGNSAWILTLMRDFARARQNVNAALALEPTLGEDATYLRYVTWWQIGLFHEWTNNAEAALAAFAKCAQLGGAAGRWAHIAALRRFGRADEALQVANQSMTDYPGNPELRLLRAEILLATDPEQARPELVALDDGSTSTVAVRAAALRGDAANAAERYANSLTNNPYAEESLELSGLRALAWKQTGDEIHRQRALLALTEALWNRHRGNVALRHEFGMSALQDDPVFALAHQAITARFESADSLLGLARIEARVAPILPEGDERTLRESRARGWLEYGVEKQILSPGMIRRDPELAPYAPSAAEADTEPTTPPQEHRDATHDEAA